MKRSHCIGKREVGRLYNIRLYEHVMRTSRQRGESDRGDQTIYFAVRHGSDIGPRLSYYTVQQALAGNHKCVVEVARAMNDHEDRSSV